MRKILILPLILILAACNENKIANIEESDAASIWEKIQSNAGKKAVIVNFWATWCAPCVEELPYFIKLNKNTDIELVLVSFDFEKQTAIDHLTQKTDVDFTTYFNIQQQKEFFKEMPQEWNGELPYTMIFKKNGEKLKFFSGKISEKELTKYSNLATQ